MSTCHPSFGSSNGYGEATMHGFKHWKAYECVEVKGTVPVRLPSRSEVHRVYGHGLTGPLQPQPEEPSALPSPEPAYLSCWSSHDAAVVFPDAVRRPRPGLLSASLPHALGPCSIVVGGRQF